MLHVVPSSNGSSARIDPRGCAGCTNGVPLQFDFSYAYQPIVDIRTRRIAAYEALIRGTSGESAYSVLSQVTDDNRYKFDQACRVKAIRTAAALAMQSTLSINFLPNAIYRPEVCIRTTLDAARTVGFPIERIMFETVEGERVDDLQWFAEVLQEYRTIGFLTAIDDFGAGHAGLNLLARFQPDVVKLDMDLIRGIDTRRPAQAIVRGVVRMCDELGIRVIAEGIETTGEFRCLEALGLHLMQGYLFARPQFEACTTETAINWPSGAGATAVAPTAESPTAESLLYDPFGGARVHG